MELHNPFALYNTQCYGKQRVSLQESEFYLQQVIDELGLFSSKQAQWQCF